MQHDVDRRKILQLSLLAGAAGLLPFGDALAVPEASKIDGVSHDFDFFVGSWAVKHRRLKQRLVGSRDWQEFDGTCRCWSLLGGLANVNERIAHRPDGTSHGLGLRAFDAKSGTWADWNLSSKEPHKIDVPIIGRFENGVGTFLSDDTHEGIPIKVRGMFSKIAPASLQWEQAFSTDGGATWETNWVMNYTRTA